MTNRFYFDHDHNAQVYIAEPEGDQPFAYAVRAEDGPVIAAALNSVTQGSAAIVAKALREVAASLRATDDQDPCLRWPRETHEDGCGGRFDCAALYVESVARELDDLVAMELRDALGEVDRSE